ncbi:pyruvate kinase [Constrictibacter sp. MBR-5]|jgi:pyruvate kinase|uniref:pyruvate kinase n=1 Tax=Constrictibacter sp. MBR-5 TaxID=3156467 RepID=UPI0033951248
MPSDTRTRAAALLAEIRALRREVAAEADAACAPWRAAIQREEFLPSAHNLACYIALRHRDLRPLQRALAPFGLSSLGRLEGRVLTNLDAVAGALTALAGQGVAEHGFLDADAYAEGETRLAAATDALFGPPPPGRRGRLMVTMPANAASDPDFLPGCVRNGMDVARINCAHDDAAAWAEAIGAIRAAAAADGRHVGILMDVAGPKARIEEVQTRPDGDRVFEGDALLLVRNAFRPVTEWPVQIRIGIPEAVAAVADGAEVWFDDGKLGCTVEQRDGDDAVLRVRHVRPKGFRVRPEKGVNFPGTDIAVSALTDKDREDLAFAARHADMIGYSFVQSAADVRLLQTELARHRPDDWQRLGLVAKIETRQGVRRLPEIIVAAAGRQPFGVMIARGDLAVELGFERMAEMQEEMLWLCEAAQIPVIWATQVLEGYVKKGVPSRGEMTDAAMAARAECIMLNKGPFAARALHLLDGLMLRMGEHQFKKTTRLRALRSW